MSSCRTPSCPSLLAKIAAVLPSYRYGDIIYIYACEKNISATQVTSFLVFKSVPVAMMSCNAPSCPFSLAAMAGVFPFCKYTDERSRSHKTNHLVLNIQVCPGGDENLQCCIIPSQTRQKSSVQSFLTQTQKSSNSGKVIS